MTDDELKEKVIEKLDLAEGPDALEWGEDLRNRMHEKAKSLGWEPLIYDDVNEPDRKVYYYTGVRTGRILKDEDWPGLKETNHFSIQEHGRYQAEVLAFLEIFKPVRE